jgi:hypothetical protein
VSGRKRCLTAHNSLTHHSPKRKETSMMISLKRFVCLALLFGLIQTASLQAQYYSEREGYNPYTGTGARTATGYNPYTGVGRTGEESYNRYTGNEHSTQTYDNTRTGTEGDSKSYHNPYTGASANVQKAYNPYTGKSAYHYNYRR